MPNRQRSDAVLMAPCRGCAGAGAPGWRWVRPLSRRALAGALAGLALAPVARPTAAQALAPAFTYPMGIPGRPLGDGFVVRHGYACENTIVQTGWWHTAEDWYLAGGAETGGSRVYAVAAGEVVFAGYDYPGLVIIIEHASDLYSSYGHLNYDGIVQVGDVVERGQLIGTVQTRGRRRRVPSHLHFELRDFLINPVVNGQNPSYGVHCGVNCPPGPGYWPMSAPEHPTALGWRNPAHVINGRAYANGILLGTDVIATGLAGDAVDLWSAPPEQGSAVSGRLTVRPGDRFRLLGIDAGPEASSGTSAVAYHVWYQIIVNGGDRAWVQAAVPSYRDTGSDGRPSGVDHRFLLDAPAG